MERQKILTNKKGWVTRDFVIAGILFSAVVAFLTLYMGGLEAEYPGSNITSEGFAANYDRLTETTDKVETMRSTSTTGEGLTFRGTFDVAFGSTFTVIQLVFSTLNLYGGLSGSIANDFSFLDSTVVQIFFVVLLSIVTTIIVFVWISSISRGKI